MKLFVAFFVVMSMLLVCACAPKPVHVPLSERVAQQKAESGNAQSGDQQMAGVITEEELRRAEEEKRRRAAEEAMKAGQLQDIYFDFDSYNIRPDDLPILKDLAARLTGNPGIKLLIEGHCDERGTTEYNLALGQKRAEAVKDYLVKSGVGESRIKALSYGKEAPLDPRHAEDAWVKNRRAHFVIQ